MKNTKKMLAAICALSLSMSIASCGSTSSSSSTDTAAGTADSASTESTAETTGTAISMKEEQKEEVASIAEKLDDTKLENTTVKFLSHWDINPAEGAVVPPDIQMFLDKYDGKFEYISTTWENRYTDLAAKVLANESPDFFSAMDMDGFPKGAIRAMFEPIDDVIDLNSDLWAPAKETNDAFLYKGQHYVAGIQSQPDIVCIYNTKVVEEKGYEDPAELYYNGEWTWSKFCDMVINFTDQDNEVVGLDGWWYSKGMCHMSGKAIIGMENGAIVNNMEDPTLTKMQGLMYDLQKNNVCYNLAANNWQVRGNTYGQGLSSGETLFYPCGMWAIEAPPENVKPYGDVEAGEVMFVPMPRMDDSDTTYVSARVDGYFLCKGAQNPEGFAAYMNCRMLCKNEAAEIGEAQLRDDYKWNDKMIEMRKTVYDLVNQNPVYDFSGGVSDDLLTVMNNNVTSATVNTGTPMTWTECVQSFKAEVDQLIEQANNYLAEEAESKAE